MTPEHTTWHEQFARCDDCGHATVGTQRPYAIHHLEGCSMPPVTSGSTRAPTPEHTDMTGAARLREALDVLLEALERVDISGQVGDVEDFDAAIHDAREVLAAVPEAPEPVYEWRAVWTHGEREGALGQAGEAWTRQRAAELRALGWTAVVQHRIAPGPWERVEEGTER